MVTVWGSPIGRANLDYASISGVRPTTNCRKHLDRQPTTAASNLNVFLGPPQIRAAETPSRSAAMPVSST